MQPPARTLDTEGMAERSTKDAAEHSAPAALLDHAWSLTWGSLITNTKIPNTLINALASTGRRQIG